jgi:UDP-N-acetylglucosamine--N-acetylmuramyl-(pentapeptide) pyrophosphoryl-undecaprenol N-acetylglucosamine transferase
MGSSLGMERELVPRSGIPAFLLPMKAPASFRGIRLLVVATLRAVAILLRVWPHVTFATGGYVSLPAGIASWLLRRPLIVFLPDVVPGRTVSFLLPLARRIAVSTDDALLHVPAGKSVVTGYPVRDMFREATRASGRVRYGIPESARVLCVFGGSQGARAVNLAVARNLPTFLEGDTWVIHICGPDRFEETREAVQGGREHSHYLLFPYLHDEDMALALAAADLAICRSGASTLGELPAAGVPAVLVPLPEVKVHQLENAEYLARHEAAVIVRNDELDDGLAPAVKDLLADETRLRHMAQAARSLDRPDAAERIAEALLEVAS